MSTPFLRGLDESGGRAAANVPLVEAGPSESEIEKRLDKFTVRLSHLTLVLHDEIGIGRQSG